MLLHCPVANNHTVTPHDTVTYDRPRYIKLADTNGYNGGFRSCIVSFDLSHIRQFIVSPIPYYVYTLLHI